MSNVEGTACFLNLELERGIESMGFECNDSVCTAPARCPLPKGPRPQRSRMCTHRLHSTLLSPCQDHRPCQYRTTMLIWLPFAQFSHRMCLGSRYVATESQWILDTRLTRRLILQWGVVPVLVCRQHNGEGKWMDHSESGKFESERMTSLLRKKEMGQKMSSRIQNPTQSHGNILSAREKCVGG